MGQIVIHAVNVKKDRVVTGIRNRVLTFALLAKIVKKESTVSKIKLRALHVRNALIIAGWINATKKMMTLLLVQNVKQHAQRRKIVISDLTVIFAVLLAIPYVCRASVVITTKS